LVTGFWAGHTGCLCRLRSECTTGVHKERQGRPGERAQKSNHDGVAARCRQVRSPVQYSIRYDARGVEITSLDQ
jgi:hypothetical protein